MAPARRRSAHAPSAGWLGLLGGLALLWPTRAPGAEAAAWTSLDVRMRVEAEGKALPSHLRASTDTRFDTRAPGLDTLQLRAGPMWEAHDVLLVGFYLLASARQDEPRSFLQEYRLELEPTLRASLGPFKLEDRNRLEVRWRSTTGTGWRYRNQLQLSLEPEGSSWRPVLAGEVLVDLSGEGLNEIRTSAGLGRKLSEGSRLELAYLLRTEPRQQEEDMRMTHTLVLTLLFAPPREPHPE